MKTMTLTSILVLFFGSIVSSQPIPPDSLYFGQTPPGNIPVLFAPGIISLPDRNEAVITFSPDGESVIFYIEKWPQPGNPYTMFATYTDNHWTSPDTIPFTIGRSTGEPFFAYNGSRLYMFATNAINHQGVADLSYTEKQGDNWGEPVSLGDPPNTENYQYHPCIVSDTSIYFSSNAGNICRSQYSNGAYQERVILPKPVNYIGSPTWGDPYVSPNETYLIFKSIREGGYGQNDLYISYKKPDGSWTNPKNFGNIINPPYDETSGDITPDSLYMTFGSNKDLYWVSTSFIESLKYTNYIPYVKNLISDQTAYVGQIFNFTIPDSTFIDDDGNSTLTYHANLSNGDPLPLWLAFDTVAATFSGTPPIIQTLDIKVTVTDTAGATAYTTFNIFIDAPNKINQNTGQIKGFRIFPNPSSGIIYISSDEWSDRTAIVEISNLAGKIILKSKFYESIRINLSDQGKGIYFVKLIVDNEIITSILFIK